MIGVAVRARRTGGGRRSIVRRRCERLMLFFTGNVVTMSQAQEGAPCPSTETRRLKTMREPFLRRERQLDGRASRRTSMPLTAKQEAFATACAKGENASEAYRAAYEASRMTAKTINEAASRLLANSKVSARIAELRAPALRRHEVSVEKTVGEIATAAYGAVDEVLTWPAKLKALEMLARIDGLFERDNRQPAQNLAIQVNLVEAPSKASPGAALRGAGSGVLPSRRGGEA
jgi:terminase small subunit-like protein